MAQTLSPAKVSTSHFATYGQPGCPLSLAGSPYRLENRALRDSQPQLLIIGFKLQEMQDKWFICLEGPNAEGKLIKFYKSWMRHKILTVEVEVDGEEG